jgi:hypothetical protein
MTMNCPHTILIEIEPKLQMVRCVILEVYEDIWGKSCKQVADILELEGTDEAAIRNMMRYAWMWFDSRGYERFQFTERWDKAAKVLAERQKEKAS